MGYILIFLFYLLVFYIAYKEKKKINRIENTTEQKFTLYALAIVLLGCIIRTVYLKYPHDINADEAMAAYDAWCLAHFGVDQYLMSFPVYFKSWGSGQNALYTYMMLPVVKFFGLHVYILRMPMALLSSASLLVLYFTTRKIKLDAFNTFIIVLIVALNPWHIMKSRWGLESNVAPDLILIGTCLVIWATVAKKQSKQLTLYIFGFITIGLAAYGYAVAWFMLPIYMLFLTIYLLRKRLIGIKQLLLASSAMLLILTPLLCFVYVLATKGETMTLGIFSMPELVQSRHETTTMFSQDATELFKYWTSTLEKLFWGFDYMIWNSLPKSGQFFNPLGWIAIAIGAFAFFKKKSLNILDSIMLLWLLSCIPLVISVEYNVNRWNPIWFPLLYILAQGLNHVLNGKKTRIKVFCVAYSLLFLMFGVEYRWLSSRGFHKEIGEHITFLKTLDVDSIYYNGLHTQHSIIYFYDPISPYELVKNRKIIPTDDGFIRYSSFGKYKTSLPWVIEPLPKTAYIIENARLREVQIDTTAFHKKEMPRYTTYWND